MYRIWCKTEGSRPYLAQICVSIAFKYIINNSVLKIIIIKKKKKQNQDIDDCNTFSFLLKSFITAFSFHWRNDTTTFVTRRVHPQISSSLRLLVLCHARPDLFVIYYCLFIFSKNSFLSLAPLTNDTPLASF